MSTDLQLLDQKAGLDLNDLKVEAAFSDDEFDGDSTIRAGSNTYRTNLFHAA